MDVTPGGCATAADKLKKCTARLQLTRNATMTASPLLSVEYAADGATVSAVKFDENYSRISSGVSDADCNNFFDLGSTFSSRSAGALTQATARITRNTCPTSSFLYGEAEYAIASSKFLPGAGSSPFVSPGTLYFGDRFGADVDATIDLMSYEAQGSSFKWLGTTCRGQYEVVAGSCMFAGQSGTPPTCSSGGGSGGGGASASMALPSVGVGALLVLSLLAVAVVGMTGLAAMR